MTSTCSKHTYTAMAFAVKTSPRPGAWLRWLSPPPLRLIHTDLSPAGLYCRILPFEGGAGGLVFLTQNVKSKLSVCRLSTRTTGPDGCETLPALWSEHIPAPAALLRPRLSTRGDTRLESRQLLGASAQALGWAFAAQAQVERPVGTATIHRGAQTVPVCPSSPPATSLGR